MAGFSKLLTKTDIQKRLSLPTKCFKPLPSLKGSHVGDFPAIDESGFVWTFQCSTRKKGHPKPVLSEGWLAFVRHKELKVGDRVKFFKEKDQSGPAPPFYRVEAEKEVKIFGGIFGARSLSEKPKHCNKMALFTSRLLKQGKPVECKLCKPGGVLATVSSRHRGFCVFIYNEINLALLLVPRDRRPSDRVISRPPGRFLIQSQSSFQDGKSQSVSGSQCLQENQLKGFVL
ncbi:hypothetical protein NC651_028144 [Populus alba x Populus x berolinensis]|nr:hypothetical protein NC651_028144 [Populus alba x Populus x berolinensis]